MILLFQNGQLVVYGCHGVCRILETEIKTINRKKVEYYVLEPIDQSGSRYYIPCGNAAAVAKLCPLVSRQEWDTLIRNAADWEEVWIPDENQRKQKYR